MSKNAKKTLLKILGITTAFSFMLYSSIPSGLHCGDLHITRTDTVSAAAGSAELGFSHSSGSGTTATDWGTNSSFFLKVYPADIDAAAVTDLQESEQAGHRYDYEKYAIYIPIYRAGNSIDYTNIVTHSTPLQVLSLPSDNYAQNPGNTGIDPITSVALTKDNTYWGVSDVDTGNFEADTNNAFDVFLSYFSKNINSATPLVSGNSYYGDGIATALTQANAFLSNPSATNGNFADPDVVYNAYLDLLKRKFDATAITQDIVRNLYEQESTVFKGERKFTLIVEPMTDLTYDAANRYIVSYYTLLNFRHLKDGTGTDVANPLFAVPYAKEPSYITYNASNVLYGLSLATPITASFIPAINTDTFCGINKLTVGTTAYNEAKQKADDFQATLQATHKGWSWFNLAGSTYVSPTTYNIVECATVNQTALDPYGLLSMSVPNTVDDDGGYLSLQDAIYRRVLDNEYIVQHYYRRTTALDPSDTDNPLLQVLKTEGKEIPDENLYVPVTLDADLEASKQNPDKRAYYISVSPTANFKNSYFQKTNDTVRQKKDYILNNDSQKDNGTPTTLSSTGCLNYPVKLKAEDIVREGCPLNTNGTFLTKFQLNATDDFELENVVVRVTCLNIDNPTAERGVDVLTWTIDGSAYAKELTNRGYYDLSQSLVKSDTPFTYADGTSEQIRLQKWFATISDETHKIYSGNHYTIEVMYNYTQGSVTAPSDTETTHENAGYFETEIPEYAINTPYTSLTATDNLQRKEPELAYTDNYKYYSGLVKAPIYADILQPKSNVQFILPYANFALTSDNYFPSNSVSINFTPDNNANDKSLYSNFSKILRYMPTVQYKNYYHTNSAGTKYQWTTAACVQFDSSFMANKNASTDHIALAGWVDNADLSAIGIGNNSADRGVSTSRTTGGTYTISCDDVSFTGTEKWTFYEWDAETNSYKTATYTDTNVPRYFHISDSKYDTVCKIANYTSKTNPNNSKTVDLPTDLTGTPSSPSTKATFSKFANTAKVKLIPEVPMIYYPTVDVNAVQTVIAQSNVTREVDLISYHTITGEMKTNNAISGVMPATDSRTQNLRNKIGTSASNAPVLYGGSDVINVLTNTDSTLTFKSYVLDVDNSSSALTEGGKTGLSADDTAKNFLNGYLATDASGHKSAKVTFTGKSTVYTDWNNDTVLNTFGLDSFDVTFTSETGADYGVPTVYDLDVRDGKVVGIKDSTGSYISPTDEIWNVVDEMKLNEVFGAAFETTQSVNNTSVGVSTSTPSGAALKTYYGNTTTDVTTHWYGEGSSVFKLKVYETQLKATDQTQLTSKIPLNAGPASVSSKNAYTTGYAVYTGYEATLKSSDGTPILKIAEDKKTGTSNVSYIIPDQTVNDISH